VYHTVQSKHCVHAGNMCAITHTLSPLCRTHELSRDTPGRTGRSRESLKKISSICLRAGNADVNEMKCDEVMMSG
jgi:hypothetical protein